MEVFVADCDENAIKNVIWGDAVLLSALCNLSPRFCLVLAANSEGETSLFGSLEQWLPAAILLAIAAIFFIFRKVIAKGILYIVLAHSRRRYPDDYRVMKEEIVKPLKIFIPIIFLTASCHVAVFIADPWHKFLIKSVDTLMTAIAFWLLFKTAMVIGVLFVRRKNLTDQPIGASAVSLLVSMIRFGIIFIGVLVILSYWVSNVAGLITGLGIGGFALTLAAQDTIGNFLGSLAILLDQPFNVGDWISTKDIEGSVELIGMRTSKIRSFDGGLISAPNKLLAEAVVTNQTKREKHRIELNVTIPWEIEKDGYEEFRRRVLEYLETHDRVNPPILAVWKDLTPQGMNMYIRCFTGADYEDMLNTKHDINRSIVAIAGDMEVPLYIPNHIVLRQDRH